MMQMKHIMKSNLILKIVILILLLILGDSRKKSNSEKGIVYLCYYDNSTETITIKTKFGKYVKVKNYNKTIDSDGVIIFDIGTESFEFNTKKQVVKRFSKKDLKKYKIKKIDYLLKKYTKIKDEEFKEHVFKKINICLIGSDFIEIYYNVRWLD